MGDLPFIMILHIGVIMKILCQCTFARDLNTKKRG